MGLLSNAAFHFEHLDNGVLHIYDDGIDEISVTNDADDVLLKIHREISLSGIRVQYTDSEGIVDRLIHDDGIFLRFASGPWTPGNWNEG